MASETEDITRSKKKAWKLYIMRLVFSRGESSMREDYAPIDSLMLAIEDDGVGRCRLQIPAYVRESGTERSPEIKKLCTAETFSLFFILLLYKLKLLLNSSSFA